ncbi:hypothetical protein ACROYT_G043726 [Oculina patagonica]
MNITNASESLKTNQADSEFSCPLLDRFLKESAGYMDTVYIANCAINAIFSFTAVIANGLIMLSIWRAPSLRTPTYYFLFGLAMSDFGVGLLSQPLYIVYKVAGLYKHFQLSCIAGISFVLISNQLSGVSFLTVALISADRALALYLHMRYNELLTTYRVKLALVAVWVLSASANVAWFTSLKVYYFIASSGFAIFLITTLFAYVMIFRTVRRHHLQIQQQSKAVSRLSTTSLQGNTNSEQNQAQRIMEQAGAHFIELCCQRNIPVVFLQNTVPQTPAGLSVEQRACLIKDQAKMMSAVACAQVPKITLIMKGSYGPSSYAMCGRSFDPRFLFTWPTARVAMDTVEDMVSMCCAEHEVDGDKIDDEKHQALKDKFVKKFEKESHGYYGSARLWDDGVILPQDTRKVLGQSLRAALSSFPRRQESKFGVFRM